LIQIYPNPIDFASPIREIFKTENTIADQTIAALTIMIVESQPAEKEMMINVIMNCIVKNIQLYLRVQLILFSPIGEEFF